MVKKDGFKSLKDFHGWLAETFPVYDMQDIQKITEEVQYMIQGIINEIDEDITIRLKIHIGFFGYGRRILSRMQKC